MLFTGLLVFLTAAAGLIGPAAAQQSPTKTETSTLWLPPRSTRAGERIFASVITAAPSSTELFLACTTAWRSASSCAQFSGVTLTYGDSSMKIAFGSESFDCKRGATATCAVAASSQTMLASAESASWFTAVTIVDGHDKLSSAKAQKTSSTSTGAAAAATSTAALCKRVSVTRPKTGGGGGGGDDCSAASGGFGGMSLAMAGAAVVVGALVTMFL